MQYFDQIESCSSKLYKVMARYGKVMQSSGKVMVIYIITKLCTVSLEYLICNTPDKSEGGCMQKYWSK